jgi:hypothetical protein
LNRFRNPITWKFIFPIFFAFILIIGYKLLGTKLITFIHTNKWILLSGLVGSIVYAFWMFPNWVKDHKQNIRRTWYFCFILGIELLLHNNGFDIVHWQRYTLLAALFIFVDLALIVTPSIVKIGNTELSAVTDVESINEEMKKAIIQTKYKSQFFTTIIDLIDKTEFGKQKWTNTEEYMYSLEEFLCLYGDFCRQDIKVYSKNDNQSFIFDVGTNSGIEITSEQIRLLDEKSIIQTEKQNAVIPFFKLYDVFIVVVSEKEPVHQIDFDHIINLAILHTWFQASENNSKL